MIWEDTSQRSPGSSPSDDRGIVKSKVRLWETWSYFGVSGGAIACKIWHCLNAKNSDAPFMPYPFLPRIGAADSLSKIVGDLYQVYFLRAMCEKISRSKQWLP